MKIFIHILKTLLKLAGLIAQAFVVAALLLLALVYGISFVGLLQQDNSTTTQLVTAGLSAVLYLSAGLYVITLK